MAADSIGFPLPVIKNGYVCLDANDIELAAKNIDPAPPKNQPEPRQAAPAGSDLAAARPDQTRVESARTDAAAAAGRVVGYSPDAVRRGMVTTGTVLSLTA